MTRQARQDTRAAVTHDLKCWPSYFHAVRDGVKTFEVRQNDRDFRVGDTLRLREWAPSSEDYTGAECERRIVYMTDFGQPDGQVVLGLTASDAREPQPADDLTLTIDLSRD